MTYAWIQDVPIGEDLYRKVVRRLGDEPLQGNHLHLVMRKEDGTLRYVSVWESAEVCDKAFEERIHPAVHETFEGAGFDPGGEPPRYELELVDLRGTAVGGLRAWEDEGAPSLPASLPTPASAP